MVADLIHDEGLILRDALHLSGCSRRSHYYQTRKRTIPPDPYILEKVGEEALKRPLYGTRRMAVTLAKELGRPINRKRIQRIYRILGWIEPQKPKKQRLLHNCRETRFVMNTAYAHYCCMHQSFKGRAMNPIR